MFLYGISGMPHIETKCGHEPCHVCKTLEEQGETPGKGGQREGFGPGY